MIYKEVRKICKAEGRTIRKALEQTVQGTLEVNSSDSDNYKAHRDIFCMPEGKGKGIWAIRKAEDKIDTDKLLKELEAL